MFFKNSNVTKHVKKIDKIVTTIIIWWAIASIFWLSKTQKWKEITKNLTLKSKKISRWFLTILWKFIAFLVSIFSKSKK